MRKLFQRILLAGTAAGTLAIGSTITAGAAGAATATPKMPADMICLSISSGDHGSSQCRGSNAWQQVVQCSDGFTVYSPVHYGSGQETTYCDSGATATDTSVNIF